ncbi:MAG: NADH-quinone oxidoreductase subunit H [Candidatus Omnitrophica bacterium]|nr:NADH-quinone oxidoreductase subunit H [Candidatus Omnitrophota bacterium]
MTTLNPMTPDVQFALYSALKIVIAMAVLLSMVAYTVLAERRIAAWIQDRVGPNRVGPWGLLQPLADAVKALLKENLVPAHVRKVSYWLAPMLVMIPSLLALTIIPFGSTLGLQKMVIADLNVGVLFTFGVAAMTVYGLVLAGYAANSKYPFLGGLRSGAQMISYEVAMALSIVPVFMLVGNPEFSGWIADRANAWHPLLANTSPLNLNRVVAYQAGGFFHWMLFQQPLAFILFLVAAFAETNRLPFDLPEAEQELAGGYNTEYSSIKFALFFMGEYANMIVASGLIVTLFLGGWTLPWFGLNHPAATFAVGLVHIAVFLIKVVAVVVLFIWVRWMWPRFRYDQLMDLAWQRFVPLALVNIMITAVVLWAQ